jgi:hypothetical protein
VPLEGLKKSFQFVPQPTTLPRAPVCGVSKPNARKPVTRMKCQKKIRGLQTFNLRTSEGKASLLLGKCEL